MQRPLSDEQMELEIKRAKRFNDIAFGITAVLTVIVVISLLLWK